MFDTLFAEGQRRYIESLSTYTRQFLEKMPKPDLDSIENIPPAIALEQKNHVVSSRSSVGTQTELVDFLRILFAKIGQTHCIDCGDAVRSWNAQAILNWAARWLPGKKALIIAPIAALKDTKVEKKVNASKADKIRNSSQGSSPSSSHARETLFQILKEQGYQRLLWQRPDSEAEVLDLNEILDGSFNADELNKSKRKTSASQQKTPDLSKFSEGELFVVVDRLFITQSLNITDPADPTSTDTRGRLLDSIDQALALGRGRMGFFDFSQKSSQNWSQSDTYKFFEQRFACEKCNKEHRIPEPHLFSFNSPLGACPKCTGFGYTLDLDESLVVPDPSKTIKNGAIDPFSKPSFADWQKDLFRFAERHGISIGRRYRELTAPERKLLWEGDPMDKTFPGIFACFEELKRWKYKLYVRVFIRRYQNQTLCTSCQGARLTPEALAVKIGDRSINDILVLPVSDALKWIQGLSLSTHEKKIAQEPLAQVTRRLSLLEEVGIGYLTLSRQTKTLSGGEFQRVNLATQLGNGLCGTLYVLDEPSIGLHASDTRRLIKILERLRNQGNTVVIVEHDLDVMKAADWLVELGPGAGKNGGNLVAQGTAQSLINNPGSLTGKYLAGTTVLKRERPPRPPFSKSLTLTGCREHNLKNITVELPLERFVVVTGVSGSGKSTLVHKTLHNALARLFYRSNEKAGNFDRLYGAEALQGVVLLDQSPIGKTSRSNPATYLKAWDELRRIYASQALSLRRGYTPQHFSFNVDGGRCPVCKGEGELTLDMHFMAEVKLPCEECQGRRFKKTILEVVFRGKNIDQLLRTTIDEAYELFSDQPVLRKKLGLLRSVGLGYLNLGQSSTTLSGGESQRLKIAATLMDTSAKTANMLYIFDEPTTGLHLEDIRKLLVVIQDLVDGKNSVLMIEHHLDVIAQADWVIDLGPGGGDKGGELIAFGAPETLMLDPNSITGRALKTV